MRLSCGMEKYV